MQRTIKDYDYKSLSPSSNNMVLTSLNFPNSNKNQQSYFHNLNRFSEQKQLVQQNHEKHNDVFRKEISKPSNSKKKNQQNVYQKIMQINKQLQDYRSNQQKIDDQTNQQPNVFQKYNSIVRNVNSEQDYQYTNNSHDNIHKNVTDNAHNDFYRKVQQNDNKKQSMNSHNELINFPIQQNNQLVKNSQQVIDSNKNSNKCRNSFQFNNNAKNLDQAKIKIFDYLQKNERVYQYQNIGQNKKQKFDNIKQAIQQKIDNFKQTSKSISRDEYNMSLVKEQASRQNYQANGSNKQHWQTMLKQIRIKTEDAKDYTKYKDGQGFLKDYEQQNNMDLNELKTQNSIQKVSNAVQKTSQNRMQMDFSLNSSQIDSKQNTSCISQNSYKKQTKQNDQGQVNYDSRKDKEHFQQMNIKQNGVECNLDQEMEMDQWPSMYQEKMKMIFEKLQRMADSQTQERKEWLKKEENYIQVINSQYDRIMLLERSSFKRQ